MGAYLKGFLVACQGIPATVFVSVLSVIIGSAGADADIQEQGAQLDFQGIC